MRLRRPPCLAMVVVVVTLAVRSAEGFAVSARIRPGSGAVVRRAVEEPASAASASTPPPADAEADQAARQAKFKAASEAAAADYRNLQRRNLLVAVGSALSGAAAFVLQRSQPVDTVALLTKMQQDSPTLAQALATGQPTVVDFYTTWCENCKGMAPRLAALEKEYRGRVNFVSVDGDARANEELLSLFGVDGIPHFALINGEGEVKTALIGLLPSDVLRADIDAILTRTDLPFEGYDAFQGRNNRLVVVKRPSPPVAGAPQLP